MYENVTTKNKKFKKNCQIFTKKFFFPKINNNMQQYTELISNCPQPTKKIATKGINFMQSNIQGMNWNTNYNQTLNKTKI